MNDKNRFLKASLSKLFVFGIFGLFFSACQQNASENQPLNVLFISIDDLRPELNSYGKSQIISPNIDQIASEGILFKRAYCNIPVCGASRASLLTGIYPTATRFTDYKTRVDEEATGIVTLPEHFKNNGYYTSTIGKIFHHPDDGLNGWSKEPYRPDYPTTNAQQELWRDYQSPENQGTKKVKLPLGGAGPAWEAGEVDDTVYYDGKTTQLALEELERLSEENQPFFFGLGYIRPHLPFNAPKKYWDLYDPNDIDLPDNYHMPENGPQDAWFNFQELRSYTNIADDTLPIPENQVSTLRHGYYACVSFIDAQIGKVIKKMKELGIYDNTIIVISGDHGWSLGEHTLWCKHSCFNTAIQSTLIIKSPEIEGGGSTQSLASFVDIYPTVAELAGLERPDHLVGKSLLPILENPSSSVNAHVFARWRNGETIKNDRFAYTQYYDEAGKVKSSMLYDHANDPEETINIVTLPDYQDEIADLKAELEKHINSRK
ncbi:MAG: sulfatase [Bacteroidota bacterium]